MMALPGGPASRRRLSGHDASSCRRWWQNPLWVSGHPPIGFDAYLCRLKGLGWLGTVVERARPTPSMEKAAHPVTLLGGKQWERRLSKPSTLAGRRLVANCALGSPSRANKRERDWAAVLPPSQEWLRVPSRCRVKTASKSGLWKQILGITTELWGQEPPRRNAVGGRCLPHLQVPLISNCGIDSRVCVSGSALT